LSTQGCSELPVAPASHIIISVLRSKTITSAYMNAHRRASWEAS